MSTALCIVPPYEAWDGIQRARHLARDSSFFYRWPPALRLFHPFANVCDLPTLAGKLAHWIDGVDKVDVYDDVDDDDDRRRRAGRGRAAAAAAAADDGTEGAERDMDNDPTAMTTRRKAVDARLDTDIASLGGTRR